MSKLHTRAEHMAAYGQAEDRSAEHRKYYAQFVNASTIDAVSNRIGAERLLASTDPYFNDIPLREWDDIAPWLPREINFKDVGDSPSQAGLVCIAKEAARQYVELWEDEQS